MGYRGKAKWIVRPAASVLLRYGLALVSVAIALGLAQTFLYFHLPQPFTAFALSAIAITFWYGGSKPGILAALFSSLIRTYFFEPEINTVSRVLYDLVFLIFALLMTGVTRARNELEVRVTERTAELTRANDDLKLEIAERRQAEYLTGQVFESSPDGVSIVGRDYRYQRVNPIYEQYGAMPAERMVGMHIADLVGTDVFEQTAKPLLDRCFEGAEVSYVGWFTNARGGRFYLGVTCSPLRPDSGRVEAALVISRDLTEH